MAMSSFVSQYWKPAALVAAAFGVARFIYWGIFGRKTQRFSVRDKVVLITGASSGLGKALATELHARGACLILTARSMDKLSSICDELKNRAQTGFTSHDPTFRYLDLADPNGFESTIKETRAEHGTKQFDVTFKNLDKIADYDNFDHLHSGWRTYMDAWTRKMNDRILGIAHYQGYIKWDEKKLNKDVEQIKRRLEKELSPAANQLPTGQQVVKFCKENACLAGGFAAGFFLGVGSA